MRVVLDITGCGGSNMAADVPKCCANTTACLQAVHCGSVLGVMMYCVQAQNAVNHPFKVPPVLLIAGGWHTSDHCLYPLCLRLLLFVLLLLLLVLLLLPLLPLLLVPPLLQVLLCFACYCNCYYH